MTSFRRPRALAPGDTIALVSPASWTPDEWIESTVRTVQSLGFQARVGAHARDRLGYLAGTDEDRLHDLNTAIRDPQVRAIACLTAAAAASGSCTASTPPPCGRTRSR